MATKLYVGNLPFKTREEDLQALFQQAGTVQSASVIRDKFSGKSRGFGFVEMATQEEADKAVEMFNNHSLDERAIVVNEAKPPQARGARGGSDHPR